MKYIHILQDALQRSKFEVGVVSLCSKQFWRQYSTKCPPLRSSSHADTGKETGSWASRFWAETVPEFKYPSGRASPKVSVISLPRR